jgi:hypothetical protein
LALAFWTLASKGVDKKSSLLSDGVHGAHKLKSAKTTNLSVKSTQIIQLGIKQTYVFYRKFSVFMTIVYEQKWICTWPP